MARQRPTEVTKGSQPSEQLLVQQGTACSTIEENQTRIAAIHDMPAAFRTVLGDEPEGQREPLAWRRAVQTAAVYQARYEATSTIDGDAHHVVLGARPDDPHARSDYDCAARCIDHALDVLSRDATLDASVEP